ncbi:hypothetical protein PRIPAC_94567 [Pristionchus pacificus]|uniref:Uncharacterized protein n=1 Tax=Pristionchus pacificus TaxID=54126 RepID=A0A2A6BAI1_PRIPA|nr:hypothetical protein PRIPAC_94567 [Pristionchus pacificus]|eukprot:PDM62895.1 hypothetical protein PRIPAC_50110 [Pristionchus pacificus]
MDGTARAKCTGAENTDRKQKTQRRRVWLDLMHRLAIDYRMERTAAGSNGTNRKRARLPHSP